MSEPRLLERAFELARSGTSRNLDEVRRRLKAERFDHVDMQLAGKQLADQLRKLIAEAQRTQRAESVAGSDDPPSSRS